MFKSKGPKFATSGKVLPSEAGEINNKAEAFVQYAVTEVCILCLWTLMCAPRLTLDYLGEAGARF